MLQTIREHTQGWIAGIIIGLIILSFALWGIHSYFVGGGNNSVVAEVNGVEINKSQLSLAYERLKRQMQMQANANKKPFINDEAFLKNRALQELISLETLQQAAVAQGFRISDIQVDNFLQGIPEFQVNGQFSVDRFQTLLATTSLSTGEFLNLLHTSLLIDQPRLGILATSFALPVQTKKIIALINQERNIEYINIPLQYFLNQPINITPAQIEAYYAQHKKSFMTPEQVNLDYIALSLPDVSVKIVPTDSMLRRFYDENINLYAAPAQWQLVYIYILVPPNATDAQIKQAQGSADTIKNALEKGEDLKKIAPAPHVVTSLATWMPLNKVMPEIQHEVAKLTQAGQIAGPVKTSKGFLIAKVLATKGPATQGFDAVKDKVRAAYVHQHAEEKFADLRDQLSDLTYEHPDSLELASKTLMLPIQTTALFSRDIGAQDISQYKKIRDVAFSNDVLHLQNNSDVLQLNPETVVVVRVKSHMPASLLPLAKVQEQITAKLKMAEAENRANQFTAELQNKLNAGTSLQLLAKTYHFDWQQTGYIGRYSTKVNPAILDLAFRLPHPITTKPLIYGVTRLPSGYAVVGLKGVKSGTVDQKQFAVFAEQVQNSEGVLEYELYKLSQMREAKIKITH